MAKVIFTVGGVNIEMEQEDASKAIEAGKLELSSDELVTYKKDEFELFKTNITNEEYKKGRKDGVEIAVKDARNEMGLEFEGKTVGNLLEAYKAKTLTEAKIEPTQKIQELESDKKALQTNLATLQTDFDGFKTTVTEKETAQKKDNALLSMMPDNTLIGKDIALMALKSKSGIGVIFNEAGTPLQTINGEVQKDKSLNPITLSKDFMIEQLGSLNLLEGKSGGTGKGDETGGAGGATSYEAFEKRMADNNIDSGSLDFNEKMQEELKAGTLKM